MHGDTPGYLPKFIYGQLFTRLPKPTRSFAGRTVIITGSDSGLGTYIQALDLTRLH